MSFIRGSRFVLLSAVACLFLMTARADQVAMKNGDRVTGSVIGKDGNNLVIKTGQFGVVATSWNQVESVLPDILLCGTLLANAEAAPQLGKILDRVGKGDGTQDSLGNDKIVAGLKEALQVGAGNAVSLTGKTDGFFRNEAIKILLPEKLRGLEKGLRAAGLGKNIDDFELSMNRAAEKAAPEAKSIFLGAIRAMTLEDGRKILTGGDTAATDYFKTKTSSGLTTAFRPTVEKAMDETEVTRRYNQLMGGIPALPFGKKESFDITDYVVSKSLDGIFHVLGEEERKIRTDPAARVTGLLKEVFGR